MMPAIDEYAAQAGSRNGLVEMVAWANFVMRSSKPLTIRQNGLDYLQRWFIVPRNEEMNIYLHRFLHSDEDRARHDHRGDNRSWLLQGQYIEDTEDGRRLVRAGETVDRKAEQPHRVELIDGEPAVSLFLIGPIRRDWGFHCPEEWVQWEIFNQKVPGSDITRGCG
jgi:hypothetical protein